MVDRRRLAAIGSLATALVECDHDRVRGRRDGAVPGGHPDLPTIELHLLVGDEVIRVASPRQPLTGAADATCSERRARRPAPIVLDPDWTPGIPARRAAFGIDDPERFGRSWSPS